MATRALANIPAALLLLLTGSAASAQSVASGDFQLRVVVPVICTVRHHTAIAASGDGYTLGDLQEYCNAPNGYMLAVDYAPGSLKGAVVAVGESRVVLDGSGHTVISRERGPRILDREIFAAPGPKGFDTDRLQFNIQAA